MPAEKHLAHGTAVHEDQAGKLFAGLGIVRDKKLAVDLEAVGGVEDDLLRDDELVHGEIGGPSLRRNHLRLLFRLLYAPHEHARRMCRVRSQVSEATVAQGDW